MSQVCVGVKSARNEVRMRRCCCKLRTARASSPPVPGCDEHTRLQSVPVIIKGRRAKARPATASALRANLCCIQTALTAICVAEGRARALARRLLQFCGLWHTLRAPRGFFRVRAQRCYAAAERSLTLPCVRRSAVRGARGSCVSVQFCTLLARVLPPKRARARLQPACCTKLQLLNPQRCSQSGRAVARAVLGNNRRGGAKRRCFGGRLRAAHEQDADVLGVAGLVALSATCCAHRLSMR